MKKNFLAIIPARGGSKGLPGKNIRELCGKPLIGWTIMQALKTPSIDKVYVSTDSEEIAGISRSFGIDVDELRPDYLARDDTSSMDVLLHVISHLEKQGEYYDYILMLECTSPLRGKDDLGNMIDMALKHPERDGVLSVGEVHTENPAIVKKINKDGLIEAFISDGRSVYQRQQFDKAFYPYGVCYLIKTDILKEKKTIYTDNAIPYYIERWQNYEVDDIYDFKCIETIFEMERGKIGL